jgi:hypothetical protein
MLEAEVSASTFMPLCLLQSITLECTVLGLVASYADQQSGGLDESF